MSILIKGMEMPTDRSRWVVIYPDGKVDYSDKTDEWETLDKGAVPVPPHGRLIDADALLVLVYANIALFDSTPGRLGADQKLVRAWLASMADDINDAPTIIPADPAEEGE